MKKYLTLIIIMLILIPIYLFAYRPSFAYNCGRAQGRLIISIMNYYDNEKIEKKSIYPGKDFDDLYNKLLEKKYVDKPLKYDTSDCSYGLTFISDCPVIYCKYHGNSVNTWFYESICSGIHFYRSKHGESGFLVFICCLVVGFFIIIIKSIVKKVIKRK